MNEEHPYLAKTPDGGLYWGPLTPGRLIKRYKRFLADVLLEDGQVITAHTANTGRMLGCSEPGRPVWLSRHDRPGRKHPFSLEMIEMPTAPQWDRTPTLRPRCPGDSAELGLNSCPTVLVGVNTMVPNRLAAAAAEAGLLMEVAGPATVEREVTVGHSRLDLRLTDGRARQIMVEVKNCTLAEEGVAYFPDAVTDRGAKHLDELAALSRNGIRAAILILVQRGDADKFSPADHIDPEWGRRLRSAVAEGVEIWPYRANLSLESITLGPALPVAL